jgi:phosphoglycolate phosphatase-like HAD superfamily hydrolase
VTRAVLPEFAKYKTWLFDCDGVLLDSNRLKTDAFHQVALEFGQAAADQLVAYHVANGGVSRHVKFRYLQEVILQRPFDEVLQRRLTDAFSTTSKALLLDCPLTEGCLELLECVRPAQAYVVSGGDQADLEEIFRARNLERYFAGIFGSPRTKFQIIDALKPTLRGAAPVVFVGDSRVDHEAAEYAQADFVFVSRYSEFDGWREYTEARPAIRLARTLAALLQQVA